MASIGWLETHNKAHHSWPAATGTSNAVAFFRPCALRYAVMETQDEI